MKRDTTPTRGARASGDRSPVTATGETEKTMVERHIREGERQVSRQQEIADAQPAGSIQERTSRQLLDTMQRTQEAHQSHLDRINRRDADKPDI